MKTKRIPALVMAASLALPMAGCAKDQAPDLKASDAPAGHNPETFMEELAKVNDSVYKERIIYNDDGSVNYTYTAYVRPDFARDRSNSLYYTWSPEDKTATGYDFANSVGFYCVTDEGISHTLENLYESPVFALVPEETVESITEENGKLLVTTTTPAEVERSYGREMPDDALGVAKYTIDAATLVVERLDSYVRNADGTEVLLHEETILYGSEKSLEEPAEYTAAFGVSDSVDVSVVFDPNTDQERVIAAKIPVGVEMDVYHNGEYGGIYLDAECTKPIPSRTPSDYAENGAATVYLTKGK